jgi:hypothetical protein
MTIGDAMACLGAVMTGAAVTLLWLDIVRLERRIAKLEMEARYFSWEAGGFHRIPPDAVLREARFGTEQAR